MDYSTILRDNLLSAIEELKKKIIYLQQITTYMYVQM